MINNIEHTKQVLTQRNMHVLPYGRQHKDHNVITVIWTDLKSGKTKLGEIRNPYYHRYGVNVLATFNGRNFWFQSGAIEADLSDDILEAVKVFDSAINSELKLFDVNSIDVRW